MNFTKIYQKVLEVSQNKHYDQSKLMEISTHHAKVRLKITYLKHFLLKRLSHFMLQLAI